MKSKVTFLLIAFFAASKLFSQTTDNCVTSVILSGYSEKAYTSEPVKDQQLDLILKCGIKAPSAKTFNPGNSQ
jgi:hypothetical protein